MASQENSLNKPEAHESAKENASHEGVKNITSEIYADVKSWAELGKKTFSNVEQGLLRELHFNNPFDSNGNGSDGHRIGEHGDANQRNLQKGSDADNAGSRPVDREAFDRRADGKDGWSLFHKDSVSDDLQNKIKDRMTPDEQKKYQEEQKHLDEYQRQMLAWGMSTIIPPPPMPERPDTPMHKEVEKRVSDAEKQIRDDVYKNMSPSEREQFERDTQRYEQEKRDAAPRNPFGTGDWREPPVPPDSVRVYWDRIRLAEQRY